MKCCWDEDLGSMRYVLLQVMYDNVRSLLVELRKFVSPEVSFSSKVGCLVWEFFAKISIDWLLTCEDSS